MYHCHLRIYLIGCQPGTIEVIKAVPPLEQFSHTFSESARPDGALADQADLILADVRALDPADAEAVLALGGGAAERILLADREQIPSFADRLDGIRDVWTAPMTDAELRFRFQRWQQTCKISRDYWETRQYLESTINSVPNLVWYKTKDGIHEKVNDSFCKTVGKTKKQVEGQGHAYIWDVEQDDPACIESERVVMTKRETCISEETVQTGDGTRLLTTYKSPLYDLDGSVMGTVGVAIDVTQERAYEQEIVKKTRPWRPSSPPWTAA